jgi:hypothetical protein
VAYSPDGKSVATGSSDRTARVMEAATGREVARLAHQGLVNAVAFSLDSRIVATASLDKTVRIFDAQTSDELHRIELERVNALRFTRDGRTLEVWQYVNRDLILTRHPLRPEDLIQEACSKVTRNLTVAEWQQYAGREVPYRRACDNLPYPPDYKGAK